MSQGNASDNRWRGGPVGALSGPGRLDFIAVRWNAGMPVAQIAREAGQRYGATVTPNAVISRARKAKLPPHPSRAGNARRGRDV